MKKHSVEAFPAYIFTCEHCGRDNVAKCQIPTEEDRQEYADRIIEEYELEEGEEWPEEIATPDQLRVIPSEIACEHCREFNTICIPDHVCQTPRGSITWMAGTNAIVGINKDDDVFTVVCVAEDCWRAEEGIVEREVIGKDYETCDEAMQACELWLEMNS